MCTWATPSQLRSREANLQWHHNWERSRLKEKSHCLWELQFFLEFLKICFPQAILSWAWSTSHFRNKFGVRAGGSFPEYNQSIINNHFHRFKADTNLTPTYLPKIVLRMQDGINSIRMYLLVRQTLRSSGSDQQACFSESQAKNCNHFFICEKSAQHFQAKPNLVGPIIKNPWI